jgi:TetR/AcrR family transcriptional regulator
MDNKENIKQKALELFSVNGYEATGVQMIADSSGISKPTLYYYFGSKKGLFEDIIYERNTRLVELIRRAAEYRKDIVTNVRKVTASYFDFAKRNKEYYRMVLSTWFYPQESEVFGVVKEANNLQFEIVREMFQKASNDHGNMKGRQLTYAYSLIGTVNTYIGLYFAGIIELDEQSVLRLSKQFMHGIFS